MPVSDQSSIDNNVELYCSFWLGEHCFGVPSTSVSQVHAPVPLTFIPGAPTPVQGYVNLRGQLYLVLDPGELLLKRPQPVGQEAELIVFRASMGEAFAIAVERVGDMLAILGPQIHTPGGRAGDVDLSSDARLTESLIVGHARLDTLLVTLVEPRKLLPAAFANAP